ncbi:MAG: histidine phosphatase family protein [Dermatophilaceae bacterium]
MRHAATADNESGSIPDARNGPGLSQSGLGAARALAHTVRPHIARPHVLVITSPAVRAQETASIVTGVPYPIIEHRISEIDIGVSGTRDPELIAFLHRRLSRVSWNLGGGPPPDTARGVGVGRPPRHQPRRGPP